MEFTEIGRRIYAARSYAGFESRKEFAEAIEISEATLVRLERGDRLTKRRELLAIAEACNVPMWFLEGGWDGWRSTGKQRGDVDAEGRAALEDLDRRQSGGDQRRRRGGR